MKKTIVVTRLDGIEMNCSIEGIPDTCPICHTSVQPRVVSGIKAIEDELGFLQVIFQCTSGRCERAFIGTYEPVADLYDDFQNYYSLKRVAPMTAKKQAFSEAIEKLSPIFVEIYNQSLAAEAAGLNQLNGIGLRKALEFLIKDYCIKQNSDKENEIKECTLGNCIENYIDDVNVKACAKRAVWLGNDETHYVRKWEDKDISDLKRLIKLTVNWIENNLLTQDYMSTMEEKKKKKK